MHETNKRSNRNIKLIEQALIDVLLFIPIIFRGVFVLHITVFGLESNDRNMMCTLHIRCTIPYNYVEVVHIIAESRNKFTDFKVMDWVLVK